MVDSPQLFTLTYDQTILPYYELISRTLKNYGLWTVDY